MLGIEVCILSLTLTPISPVMHPAFFASFIEGLIPVDRITISVSILSFPTTTVSAFLTPKISSIAFSRTMLTPTLSR